MLLNLTLRTWQQPWGMPPPSNPKLGVDEMSSYYTSEEEEGQGGDGERPDAAPNPAPAAPAPMVPAAPTAPKAVPRLELEKPAETLETRKATSPTRTPSRNRPCSRRSRSRDQKRGRSVRLTENSSLHLPHHVPRSPPPRRSQRHRHRGHSRGRRRSCSKLARNRRRRDAHARKSKDRDRRSRDRSRTPLRRSAHHPGQPVQLKPKPARGKDDAGHGSYVQCELCAKWLPSLTALAQHQRDSSYCMEKQNKGSAKSPCPGCGKPITNQDWALKQHFMTSPSCTPKDDNEDNDGPTSKPKRLPELPGLPAKAKTGLPVATKLELEEALPPPPAQGAGPEKEVVQQDSLASSFGNAGGSTQTEDRNAHLASLFLNLGHLMMKK